MSRVRIAHSNLTWLIKATDAALMRLNLPFLLLVSLAMSVAFLAEPVWRASRPRRRRSGQSRPGPGGT